MLAAVVLGQAIGGAGYLYDLRLYLFLVSFRW